METPEKVYLLFNRPYLVDYAKLNKRRCEEEVEYTRTDAFMEKIKEWIKNNAEKFVVNTPLCNYYDYKRAIENFENYIKGE